MRVVRAIDNCNVYTLWMDPVLNEAAYILPGLGDAGDRINGKDGDDHPRNIMRLIADLRFEYRELVPLAARKNRGYGSRRLTRCGGGGAFCVSFCVCLLISCGTLGGTVVGAEEYFSIANAYFELGKFPEAERWFNLARQYEKSEIPPAEYNLARIAFNKNAPEDAARRFEALLKLDPSNTMILRAAAYSWMKAEKWDKALALFEKIDRSAP